MSMAIGGGNANSGANNPTNINQYAQYVTNADGTTMALPSQLMSTQSNLQQAQAGAVHDQLKATQLTEADKMQRFNQIFSILGPLSGRIGAGGVYTPGGTNSPAPPITTGPVLNPQQIQQQVNQSNANVDKSTGTNIQHMQNDVGGRGFGSNSPLSMALAQGYQNQGLATRTGNETNLRLNAAQMNSNNLLNTQQALSNQWQQGNQLQINRQTPYIQQQTALLQSLAGLV